MDVLPLLPGDHHRLRHGRELLPGEPSGKVYVTHADGSRDWDRKSYSHQSKPGLVLQLLSRVKSQGVWSKDEAWAEFSDPSNLGARWLMEQDDPGAMFEEMWEKAYDVGPRLSYQQLVQVLVQLVEDEPGIRLRNLRKAAADAGWRNHGDLDKLLAGLASSGLLHEVKELGPGGARVTSRRFWRATAESALQVARAATATLSLSLLAVSSPPEAVGQKDPVVDRSFLRLLTDKKLRAEGLRLLRRRLGGPRAWASRRPAAPRPPARPQLSPAELAWIRAELDMLHLDLWPELPRGAAPCDNRSARPVAAPVQVALDQVQAPVDASQSLQYLLPV
jgi:hypothetical protein